MPSVVRNILQTVQERTIIKTAPDFVCYLEGLPYIRNPYLETSQSSQQPVYVSFNNHITAIQGQYDVDSLIPTCSFSMSVPNDQKHLYMAPGGNHIIQAMMEIQIYAKGYYLSTNGNSIYHRIFKGLVSHASYNDNGKTLEISVQCHGVLQFLEQMQIDLCPAIMSNSPNGPTVLISNQGNMNPLLAIMDCLTRSITTAGFQLNSLKQTKVTEGPYFDAIKANYIAKWQKILDSVRADVHIYGLTAKDNPNPDDSGGTFVVNTGKSGDKVKNPEDPRTKPVQVSSYGQDSEATQYSNILYDKIRAWAFDAGAAGQVPLLNGRIVSRAERMRALIQSVMYEGYQDIDGSIIMKPPLFNLDVTQLETPSSNGSSGTSSSSKSSASPSTDIYNENNPFIIYLDEIESEQETEDQQGIRATRMTVRGPFDTHWQVTGTDDKQYVSEYCDIKLMSQFGLREEPARYLGFMRDDDKLLGFAMAVNELVKANRGFRTYQCRVPFRPELKLGFPCFFPHRDMYGYLRACSYTYSVGGQCVMDLAFDMIRRRPVYPTTQNAASSANSGTGTSNTASSQDANSAVVLTSAPNLINRWTKISSSDTSGSGGTQSAQVSDNSSKLDGQPASLPLASTLQPTDDAVKLYNYRRNKLGSTWGVQADTPGNAWRVQNDTEKLFTKQIPCDKDYISKILYAQPYTDDKGYELITPFPWGRWNGLKDAIHEFTQTGYIVPATVPNPMQLKSVQTFLFAGVGVPTGNTDSSSKLASALTMLEKTVGQNTTVFELTYPTDNSQQGDLTLTQQGTPDAALQTAVSNDVNKRIQMFVLGPSQPAGNADAALNLAITPAQESGVPTTLGSVLTNVAATLKGTL